MDENRMNEQNNQTGQNDPYGNTMPPEIPIPDMKWGNPDISYGPQEQQYMPQNPKKTTAFKILLAVACVVAVVFTTVGIGVAYFRSTAAYKLGKGIQNLTREAQQSRDPLAEKIGMEDIVLMAATEGSFVSTRFNFSSEEMYGATLGIDTECYKDVQNKKMSADTSLSVMNYEFAHLNLYADEEALCFSIPELFLENMYIENEDVVSQYNRSIWTDVTGYSDMEDFSIDFFADEEERLSLREWKDMAGFAERYSKDLEACREKMVLEKAKKGFYRIVLPAGEMDDLLWDMMESYESLYTMADEMIWWEAYDRLIDSDISVLFEIDRQNHIKSIAFEKPVKMLDGEASVECSLHFLGEERSIDKMQGDIVVCGADDVERSIHYQILQTPSDDTSRTDLDIDIMEEQESLLRMKYTVSSDAVRDAFEVNFSMWDDVEDIELILEGSLDDIVRGRSLELELDKLAMNIDGEELFKVTGNIVVEPLDGEVTSTVQKETAFFEMTEEEWLEIAYMIDDEYGGLLNYLSYLWW